MAGSETDQTMLYGCPFTCGKEFASLDDVKKHAKVCPSNPQKDDKKIKAELDKAEKLKRQAEEAEQRAKELEVNKQKAQKGSQEYKRNNGIGKEQVFGVFVMAQPVKIWGDDSADIPGQGGFLNMLQFYRDKGYELLKIFTLPNYTPAAIFTKPEPSS